MAGCTAWQPEGKLQASQQGMTDRPSARLPAPAVHAAEPCSALCPGRPLVARASPQAPRADGSAPQLCTMVLVRHEGVQPANCEVSRLVQTRVLYKSRERLCGCISSDKEVQSSSAQLSSAQPASPQHGALSSAQCTQLRPSQRSGEESILDGSRFDCEAQGGWTRDGLPAIPGHGAANTSRVG